MSKTKKKNLLCFPTGTSLTLWRSATPTLSQYSSGNLGGNARKHKYETKLETNGKTFRLCSTAIMSECSVAPVPTANSLRRRVRAAVLHAAYTRFKSMLRALLYAANAHDNATNMQRARKLCGLPLAPPSARANSTHF